MAVLTGEGIDSLVELLHARSVTLWHACQYVDFCSYIELGGIPSRKLLENSDLRYTKFETDEDDKKNGVWHRVFVNPEDHGDYFASGAKWTPNPYGPIQIQIFPSVLRMATEVAWTRRSAGARDFELNAECIDSIEMIDNLFMYADLAAPEELRSKLNFTPRIREILRYDRAGRPEINIEIDGEVIPIDSWISIRFDRITIAGKSLKETVNAKLNEFEINKRVFSRNIKSDRWRILEEMSIKIANGVQGFYSLLNDPETSPELRYYLNQITDARLEYQFNRWEKYLHSGTLQP